MASSERTVPAVYILYCCCGCILVLVATVFLAGGIIMSVIKHRQHQAFEQPNLDNSCFILNYTICIESCYCQWCTITVPYQINMLDDESSSHCLPSLYYDPDLVNPACTACKGTSILYPAEGPVAHCRYDIFQTGMQIGLGNVLGLFSSVAFIIMVVLMIKCCCCESQRSDQYHLV